jgi:uncharacterized protein YcbX
MTLRLSEIYCYPIKSARGHRLETAVMDDFGLRGDRRWMLIDEDGQFLSQRRVPQMALLDVEPTPDGLRLTMDGEMIEVATPGAEAERVSATVWEHSLLAPLAAATANHWLSDRFAQALRLVYCPRDSQRPVDPDYAPPGQRVAFSDGFPLLIVSQASLDDLNARLPTPVPMDRFRPNLVISGADAYAEDNWTELCVGDVRLSLVKPCSRCAVPGIDQQSAGRDPHINRVLAGYRRRDGAIYFGMNALAPANARFTVGQHVECLS